MSHENFINGRAASAVDVQWLQSVRKLTGQRISGDAITADMIDITLDSDGDFKVEWEDVGWLVNFIASKQTAGTDALSAQVQVFGQLDTLLRKYGYDLPTRVSRESLAPYATTCRKSAPTGALPAQCALWSARDFVLRMLPELPDTISPLAVLPVAMRGDLEIVQTAVRRNGRALADASLEMRSNRDVVLMAVAQDATAWQYAAPVLRSDPKFLLACVRVNPNALREIPQDTANYDELVENALRNDPTVVGALAPLYIQKHFELFARVSLENHTLLAALGQQPKYGLAWQREVWKRVQSLAHNLGLQFDDATWPHYDAFIKDMQHRVPAARFEVLRSIVDLYDVATIGSMRRPIALLVFNTNDWNDGFANRERLRALVDNNVFLVEYREARTEADVLAAIDATRAKFDKPIHTLIFAGHGTATTLNMGQPPAGASADPYEIDASDLGKDVWHDALQAFDPAGQLLLYACSNGEGGATGHNLANAFAAQLPPTFTVFAAPAPGNIADLTIDHEHRLHVQWDSGLEYVTHGRRGVRSGPAGENNSDGILLRRSGDRDDSSEDGILIKRSSQPRSKP